MFSFGLFNKGHKLLSKSDSVLFYKKKESNLLPLSCYVLQILRKVALKVVEEGEECEHPIEVKEANLGDFVGKPLFTRDRLYDSTLPSGVVMGLAWTSMGEFYEVWR